MSWDELKRLTLEERGELICLDLAEMKLLEQLGDDHV
jgi:hypothetical protein